MKWLSWDSAKTTCPRGNTLCHTVPSTVEERTCLLRTLIYFHKHLISFVFTVCMKQSPYLPLKDKATTTPCCGYHSGDQGVTFKLLSETLPNRTPFHLGKYFFFSTYNLCSPRATTLCPLAVFCLCPDTYLYFCGFLVAFSAENAPLLCPAVFIYDLMNLIFLFMSSPCLMDCAKPLCLRDLSPTDFSLLQNSLSL